MSHQLVLCIGFPHCGTSGLGLFFRGVSSEACVCGQWGPESLWGLEFCGSTGSGCHPAPVPCGDSCIQQDIVLPSQRAVKTTSAPATLRGLTLLLCASVFSSVKWLVVRIKRTNAWKAHSTSRVASNHSAPNAARAWPDDAFVYPTVGLSMLSG